MLPSSFTGSPRCMTEKSQDSMTMLDIIGDHIFLLRSLVIHNGQKLKLNYFQIKNHKIDII